VAPLLLQRAKRPAIAILAAVLFAVGYVVWALDPPQPLQAATNDFVLRGVTLVEPKRGRTANVDLRVARGVVEGVAADATTAQALEEFRGHFVLPGLVDMHSHLPAKTPLKLTGYALYLYLAYGVTSIRVVGDSDGTADPTARALIADGTPGPRIFDCGPFVVGTSALRWPNSVIIERPGDADAAVLRLKQQGHVCVKAYEDLDRDKLRALATAAHKYGMRMLGHVPYGIGYEEGLVPEVQHYLGVPRPGALPRDHIMDRATDWSSVDDVRLDEIVAATLKHGTVNTPTLVSTAQLLLYRDYRGALGSPAALLMPRLYSEVVWNPKSGIPFWRGIEDQMARVEDAHRKKVELTRRLFAVGAPLLLGTDTQQPFISPGLSLQQEMKEFAQAGIPLEDIWAMATWRAAEALGMPMLGRLTAGAPADCLVFRDDPTRDLAALDTLVAVVADGRLYRRADLDRARAEYDRHWRSTVIDTVSLPAARRMLKKTVLRDY
jgi:Amidohydrolase family